MGAKPTLEKMLKFGGHLIRGAVVAGMLTGSAIAGERDWYNDTFLYRSDPASISSNIKDRNTKMIFNQRKNDEIVPTDNIPEENCKYNIREENENYRNGLGISIERHLGESQVVLRIDYEKTNPLSMEDGESKYFEDTKNCLLYLVLSSKNEIIDSIQSIGNDSFVYVDTERRYFVSESDKGKKIDIINKALSIYLENRRIGRREYKREIQKIPNLLIYTNPTLSKEHSNFLSSEEKSRRKKILEGYSSDYQIKKINLIETNHKVTARSIEIFIDNSQKKDFCFIEIPELTFTKEENKEKQELKFENISYKVPLY
jgi:hypothetical protein